MKQLLKILRSKFFVIPTLSVLIIYVCFLNYIDYTEIGIEKNILTGYVEVQKDSGWHFTPPWVFVVSIDTRPIRVSVHSAGRGVSSKLVKFEPKFWKEFIETEGWRYYWWSNRLSFNFGYKEEHRGFKDIMRGYGYSSTSYPFITIMETL